MASTWCANSLDPRAIYDEDLYIITIVTLSRPRKDTNVFFPALYFILLFYYWVCLTLQRTRRKGT